MCLVLECLSPSAFPSKESSVSLFSPLLRGPFSSKTFWSDDFPTSLHESNGSCILDAFQSGVFHMLHYPVDWLILATSENLCIWAREVVFILCQTGSHGEFGNLSWFLPTRPLFWVWY